MLLLWKGISSRKFLYEKNNYEMALLLKKHNIIVPTSIRKDDHREETEEHEEKCHALNARFSTAHASLIDFGASNQMVASR